MIRRDLAVIPHDQGATFFGPRVGGRNLDPAWESGWGWGPQGLGMYSLGPKFSGRVGVLFSPKKFTFSDTPWYHAESA